MFSNRIFRREEWNKLGMPSKLQNGGYNIPQLVVVDAVETDKELANRGLAAVGPCMSNYELPLKWNNFDHTHLISRVSLL